MLKRLSLSIATLALFCTLGHAWPWDQTPDRTNHIQFATSQAATLTSTTTLLIDLSDTTLFPHKNTREINISSLRLNVDKVAASTGTVRIGVVNTVNTSTGSVTWFFEKSYQRNVSNTDPDVVVNYSPNFIKARVEGGGGASAEGTTPYLFSNNKTTSSTAYQTDVVLPSVTGTNTAPGLGDILLEVNKDAANIWDVNVEVEYHTPETR